MPFTGKAVYDTGNWDEIAEDVSDLLTMISPFETPALDALEPPDQPAESVLHEWVEDRLNPDTVVSSTDVSTSGTYVGIVAPDSSVLTYMQPGVQLYNNSTGEYLQVTALSGNTITVTRQFGSTSTSTISAGDVLFVISDTALEGADVSADRSRPRGRVTNYCQIMKKDIIVSGTELAVRHLGGIGNEYDQQKAHRLREALRDLEKAVIRGKLSGNTLGSSTAYRTMRGIWDFIPATVATSTGTLTPEILDDVWQKAWDNGATDLNLIVADSRFRRLIDRFKDSWTDVEMVSENYKRKTSYYEGSYGQARVVTSRWMPLNSLMILSTDRVFVVPLRGRDMHHEAVSKTGDSQKGMVLGEYTVEVRNATGLAKAYG